MSKTSRGMTPDLYATAAPGPSRKPLHPTGSVPHIYTKGATSNYFEATLTQYCRGGGIGVRRGRISAIVAIEVSEDSSGIGLCFSVLERFALQRSSASLPPPPATRGDGAALKELVFGLGF